MQLYSEIFWLSFQIGNIQLVISETGQKILVSGKRGLYSDSPNYEQITLYPPFQTVIKTETT